MMGTEGFYDAMRSKGFSPETVRSLRKFKCPDCGFEFSMIYARTIACQGCSEAMKDCPKVRCAKCDLEILIRDTPEVIGKYHERHMADHISRIVTKYNKDMGWSGRR